jgi:hypothetical protein
MGAAIIVLVRHSSHQPSVCSGRVRERAAEDKRPPGQGTTNLESLCRFAVFHVIKGRGPIGTILRRPIPPSGLLTSCTICYGATSK